MTWSAGSEHPAPAVLGDPASLSALGAALRRAAYDIDVGIAGLGEAEPGVPLNRHQRARVRELQQSAAAVTASMERTGEQLTGLAADLAAAIGLAQRIGERAESSGLRLDGPTIERVSGVHGVADAAAEAARTETLSRLQRVLDAVLLDLDTRRRALCDSLAKERERVLHPLA